MIRLADSSAMRTAVELPYSIRQDRLSKEECERIFARLPRSFWVRDISISRARCAQLAAQWEKEGLIRRVYTPRHFRICYEKVNP